MKFKVLSFIVSHPLCIAYIKWHVITHVKEMADYGKAQDLEV